MLGDLAADISEAPHVLTTLLQLVMHDVQYAAANAMYPEGLNPGAPPARSRLLKDVRCPHPPIKLTALPSPPMDDRRYRPRAERAPRQSASRMVDSHHHTNRTVQKTSTTQLKNAENELDVLCRFVSETISLASSKLSNPVATGRLRNWSRLGPANWGLVNCIGDAVMDLWDLSMRNPYAPGGVGHAFQQAVVGYLDLMASSCKKHDSAHHRFAAQSFLSEGGHSVVSLDQLLRGLWRSWRRP